MIPEAAVEAAVEAHCEGTMLAALEAAYPILLSHEREETRLAHIDAMVNRETSRDLLAQAWDAAITEAEARYMVSGSDADELKEANPYRSARG